MRHKIAFRLALSFLLLTLASALVIGVVFTFMFRDHVVTAKKEEMLAQARAAATTLSQDTWSGAMGMGRGGPQRERFGSALQLLDDMSLGHTWIVDESLQLITAGRGAHAPSYAQLPQDADAVVREVFAGNTVFSEQFSGLMDAATLTLGYPVVRNGQVSAALLMHEPVSGISQAFVNGSSMLMYSLLAALALSALISVPLAKRLVRPLQQMKTTALRLAQGDYQAQTGVRSRDEIGELAQALDTLSLRLEEARQESDRLEKLRRDFIANISHELRTPVTVIRGSLEALSEGVVSDPDQMARYYGQMLAESRQLERLVNDLLDLSKLQSVDYHLQMDQVNLVDVLSDAVRSGRQMAQEKQVTIALTMPDEPVPIQGDYGRLRQMVLILLSNAIKFSPEGKTVEVTLRDRTLWVADRGPGIDPAVLPHLFDRFHRTRSEDNKEGSGLGLAILKEIADRHGIAVQLDNREGGGMLAELTL